jgi:diguanylate cyclase (GGDEF)-like protein
VRSHRFELRAPVALLCALLVASGVEYLLASRQVANRVFDEATDEFHRQARQIERAARRAQGDEVVMAKVSDALSALGMVDGVVHVCLIDARGVVVAASHPSDVGSRVPVEKLAPVLTGNKTYAGDERDLDEQGHHRFEFLAPVDLPQGRFVLEIDRHGDVVHALVADLRLQMLGGLVLVLVLTLALFYVLGARSLGRRHRGALRAAGTDPLTGLGNQRAFEEQLTTLVAHAQRHALPLALAVVDVDHFKLVNDRFGHRHGDGLLREVAALLGARPGDAAFRIGGDEFALVLPMLDGEQACRALNRIRAAVSAHVSSATLSVGVADVSAEGYDAETLWERADAALYEAKRQGRDRVASFSVAGAGYSPRPLAVQAVRDLLAEPRIGAVFQPVWDLAEHRIVGFEGLARPAAGGRLDGPADAFDTADRVRRAPELDSACRGAILAAAAALPQDTTLFLNLHPSSLGHPLLDGATIVNEVRAAGLEPERVVLELTERASAQVPVVIAEAQRLRALGFRLALDDVGAGNAGLEILRHVAFDVVKIDRAVVSDARANPTANAVLLATVLLARRTGAYVVAEGIEDAEILSFVKHLRVPGLADEVAIQGAQGFHLGVPADLPARAAA